LRARALSVRRWLSRNKLMATLHTNWPINPGSTYRPYTKLRVALFPNFSK
jgi:hypothetical protein